MSNGLTFDKIVVFTGIGFATGLFANYVTRKWSSITVAISQLVNSDSVQNTALSLQNGTNNLALAAWDYVGADIDYVFYGSTLHFYDHHVYCQKCLLPYQVEDIGEANCVGKSVLLASLLRNYYGPEDVYVVIGEFKHNGVGGHAWVNLRRNGTWYVIEATVPPPDNNPWKSASDLSEIYIPDAWFNDKGVICYDPDVCTMDFVVTSNPPPVAYIWR